MSNLSSCLIWIPLHPTLIFHGSWGVAEMANLYYSFWRPLFGPLQDWPLALCDYTSFDLNDLEPVDHVYPDRVEETYSVYSNPDQKWYFLRDQRDDEALMFKTYDSNTEVARCKYLLYRFVCGVPTCHYLNNSALVLTTYTQKVHRTLAFRFQIHP